MHSILQDILTSSPVITDGAWGTQLQAAGLQPGECPDYWNITHPERVEAIALSYVDAGSVIILTNTFRANRIALKSHNLEDRSREINRCGVEISRRAAKDRAKVFASMGPSGRMMMLDEVTEDELREAFTEQAQALSEAGADGILIETMSDLAEAKIAVVAARSTNLPVVASMVFDSGKDRDRTMMGQTPEQVAEELLAAGADIVGANCGSGIESYIPICRRLHAVSGRPVWIKPNAGLPEIIHGKIVYKTTDRTFAQYAQILRDAGAGFIGGCCGTTPEFIRELVRWLRT